MFFVKFKKISQLRHRQSHKATGVVANLQKFLQITEEVYQSTSFT